MTGEPWRDLAAVFAFTLAAAGVLYATARLLGLGSCVTCGRLTTPWTTTCRSCGRQLKEHS